MVLPKKENWFTLKSTTDMKTKTITIKPPKIKQRSKVKAPPTRVHKVNKKYNRKETFKYEYAYEL